MRSVDWKMRDIVISFLMRHGGEPTVYADLFQNSSWTLTKADFWDHCELYGSKFSELLDEYKNWAFHKGKC